MSDLCACLRESDLNEDLWRARAKHIDGEVGSDAHGERICATSDADSAPGCGFAVNVQGEFRRTGCATATAVLHDSAVPGVRARRQGPRGLRQGGTDVGRRGAVAGRRRGIRAADGPALQWPRVEQDSPSGCRAARRSVHGAAGAHRRSRGHRLILCVPVGPPGRVGTRQTRRECCTRDAVRPSRAGRGCSSTSFATQYGWTDHGRRRARRAAGVPQLTNTWRCGLRAGYHSVPRSCARWAARQPWTVSTPRSRRWAARTRASRGPGLRCDRRVAAAQESELAGFGDTALRGRRHNDDQDAAGKGEASARRCATLGVASAGRHVPGLGPTTTVAGGTRPVEHAVALSARLPRQPRETAARQPVTQEPNGYEERVSPTVDDVSPP